MTSKPQKIEPVKPISTVNHITKKKTKLKGGSMHEIDEINGEYLDEILHNTNL